TTHAGVAEEERHPHRDGQLVPVALGHREVRVVAVPLGHRAEAPHGRVAVLAALGARALVCEQQRAGPAGAQDAPILEIRDVTVFRTDRLGAHVTPLTGRPARPGQAGGLLSGRPLTFVPLASRGEPAQAHGRSLPSLPSDSVTR